jgi:hypothetical protein
VSSASPASWTEPVELSSRDFVLDGYTVSSQGPGVDAVTHSITGKTVPSLPAGDVGTNTSSSGSTWASSASNYERGAFLDGDHTWLGATAWAGETAQLERHVVAVQY